MNHLDQFTLIASTASQRYVDVLGVFRSMLNSSELTPFSKRSAEDLRSQALEVARAFWKSESTVSEHILLETAQDAISNAHSDLKEKPSSKVHKRNEAFLEQSHSFLMAEIWAQLQRDVEALVKRYREFGLMVDLTARHGNISREQAILKTLAGAQAGVRFTFKDRAGRLHISQRFMRTLWRHSLVCLYADFYMLEAVSLGAEAIEITNTDPNHLFTGHIINVADNADYLSLREEIFHPNSTVILKAIG